MTPYNPWHPMNDPVDKKHIGKLLEELGEAVAASSRCLIQGINGVEPVTGKANKKWLEEEFADVMAQLQLSAEHFDLDMDFMLKRAEEKYEKCGAWHQMA